VFEGSENFSVAISNPTNAKLGDFTQIATIVDDTDLPKVSTVIADTVVEGISSTFTVNLSNASVNTTTVDLTLTNGTATIGTDTGTAFSVSYDGGKTYTTLLGSTATVPVGATSFLVKVNTIDDTRYEGSENYTLRATANGVSASGTAIITDNDFAPLISSVTGDDDNVNENSDTNAANNIIQVGTIQNVASTDIITLSGASTGITSNNQAVSYAWNAEAKTLTASSSEGTVFTIVVNVDNTSYSFTQLKAIDHLPTIQGENELKALNFNLAVEGGISNVPFTVSIYDDAPSISGTTSIVTANDGSYTETGYLSQATVSNDITSVKWNTAGLPTNLVYEGHAITYVDDGKGSLIGKANGTDVFKVNIDTSVINANGNPEYTFELLNSLGRIGTAGDTSTYTVISGGNIDNLKLGFGSYLIDSMTSVDGTGKVSTVNTNNSWIGVGGNWIDNGDKLFMSFSDPSGKDGQVKGMNMLVEGQGSGAYTLNWTVTAAIDIAGNTITYSGSAVGSGNSDVPFTIPLQNGAIYFTDLTISAPPTTSDEFRIAFSMITSNDYFSDIPLTFGYSLVDADGDSAAGSIGVTLTSPVLPTTNDTTATGNEDTTIAVTLSGADSDGSVTGYKISELPLNGVLYKDAAMTQTLNTGDVVSTSIVYFKPAVNWNGTTNFKYAAVDNEGNVDITPAVATITVNPVNDAPIFGTTTATATVSEEGLSGGVSDTLGTSDTTNATVATGTFSITDDIAVTSVSLGTPSATLISSGQTITWTGVNTGHLIGSAGGKEIIDISINNTGAYTVTLKGPVDHATAGAEDVKSFNVGVTASDGTLSSTGTLSVNIEDDSPVAVSLIYGVEIPKVDHNLLIVLDMSYSMLGNNLTAAKSAIQSLLTNYENMGEVRVQLVTFGTNALSSYLTWETTANAKIDIQNLAVDTRNIQYTNYDAAIESAMNAFVTSGKLVGANNVSYFLTDGEPTAWVGNKNGTIITPNALYDTDGSGSTIKTYTDNTNPPADAGLEDNEVGSNGLTWTQFLNNNDVNSYAIGFGGAAGAQAQLAPIAYNGTGVGSDPAGNVLVSPSLSDLTKVLLSTLPVAVSGSLLTGVTPGSIGADGGFVSSLSANGKVYTWDQSTDTFNASGATSSNYSWDTTTNTVSINMTSGGKFEVAMDTGAYKYWTPASGTTDIVGFTLKDNDGDTSSGSLNLVSSNSKVQILTGTSGDDVLIGNDGADTLLGGAGNDTLIFDAADTLIDGGLGSDTLQLLSGTSIDFSILDNSKIKNIEIIDLGHGGTADNHALTNLSVQDVIDMTDGSNTLTILGDTSDTVTLAQGTDANHSWTKTQDNSSLNGHIVDIYQNGDKTVTLNIEDTTTHSIV